ncbi:hypothetical protein F7725_002606 [Dissostichus mawsoni]|uniref:G-protein coupled receptors family 1 profile domain-containing protein n=1 Tax=Dissostichus mawsoni TaxID=36200 RepID=A0A7J5Y529_DISMA|nr:hypothetical protein F7725_002606 [Dissostichus mawsoni]
MVYVCLLGNMMQCIQMTAVSKEADVMRVIILVRSVEGEESDKEESTERSCSLSEVQISYFVIMFTAYVLIICSNSTIVCIIVLHRNLHEPMYMFIAALLINSVLYSTNIYPKLLIDFLSEKQIISYQACLFQTDLYHSFLLLAAMAYDRYVSICKPLQYSTIMRKRTVNVCLVLSWLLPTCETAVGIVFFANSKLCSFTFRGIFCNNSIYNLQCVSSSALSVYGVFCW